MGKKRKRPRNKKPKPPKPKQPKFRPNMTANERMIAALLVKSKKRGNPRDYVVVSGLRLIDSHGSFDIKTPSNEAPKEGVVLVHKKNLHKLLGDEAASKFWNRKTGTRVPPPAPPPSKSDAPKGEAPATREPPAQLRDEEAKRDAQCAKG